IELKNEIIAYTEKKYGFKAQPKNIIISGGAKQAIYNFLMAVVDPGSEVIFPAPYWVSYPDMVKLAYGTPVVVRPKEGSLLTDIDTIEKHITSNTRAILLNSPNNPSGAVYSGDFIGKLVEICENRNIYLLTDDIYGRLVSDGVKTPLPFSFSKKDINDSPIVSVNGVSKMYSMTGFRIGWSIGNEAIIKAMTKIQGQITSCPSDLSQTAAIGALRDGEGFIKEINVVLSKKRNILIEELKKFKKVKLYAPTGTFYSFPDFSAYDEDSTRLANMLIEKAMVVTVPGVEFGLEGHLRISYCGEEKDIIEGLRRMREVLDK
ncbi:MAG: aminotransferase class I/II-fold pyridoxal phosphate-dependent enzyme, partial [Elusimicrobiales bacterium]|nr:aminotransferase class I/II-fold pyridoxal phosphate-dependent enzyme [Elusimicrobiales bacterium]